MKPSPRTPVLALILGLGGCASSGSHEPPQPRVPAAEEAGGPADPPSAGQAANLGPEGRDAPPACFDRAAQPHTSVADAHVHFRPFNGPAIPFDELVGYLEATGVRFATVMGIGQVLPASSSCTYYLDCPGVRVSPSLRNDFANATALAANPPDSVHLVLAMTFPDMSQPRSILPGIALLDKEFPGCFDGWARSTWSSRRCTETITKPWKPTRSTNGRPSWTS